MDKNKMITCPVCKVSHVPLKANNDNGTFASTCENCGHFFKFRAVPPFHTDVTFKVNGQQYTVNTEFPSSASLNDFLRQKRVSMGTKVFCRQGGCGICIVVAKMKLDPASPAVTANLNSCLCPLFLCDGWEITTVEGLGSTKTTIGPVQKALSDFMGTQCGFCSPGQVMNMHGIMQKYPNLTKQQVENLFEGNLCRCTGYRPILDAMKSLVPASSPDIEDLKICKTSGQRCNNRSGVCGGTCHTDRGSKSGAIRMVFADTQWYKATDYADLVNIMAALQGKTVRFLGANTGTGYFENESIDNYDCVIDISGVSDFYTNTHDATTGTFSLGPNVTLTDLLDIFTSQAAKTTDMGNFDQLMKYLYRVASSPIRNRGTWAGNLMMKNKYPTFPSDVFNIMTALNASITIGPTPQSIVTVDGFFKTDMTGKVISKVTFHDISPGDVVACYKVMPRSQNALAHVNAAIRCTVNKTAGFTVTGQPIISIGGISGTFHRATNTENYLKGKQLSSPACLSAALTTLAAELIPDVDIGLTSASYRKTVACGLLYKYFLHVLGANSNVRNRSACEVLHDSRPVSSGSQSYDTNKLEWPLNQPYKKLEADIQCTGEAPFTDDLPDMPGQLHASFVTSTKANATIAAISTVEAMKITGVVRILTHSDIPKDAVNDVRSPLSYSPEVFPEELFSSGKVQFYGQSIALVIAETQAIADKAAKLVKVSYSAVQTPIVNIDDAIAAKSFFKKPMPAYVFGNPDQAISNAPLVTSGNLQFGEQKHFSMETLATNVVPTEDGLDVVATTQWVDSIQQAISKVTAIPKNRINSSLKRVGGSYGGKITRCNINAAACGLAAKLTNRPVRMRTDIKTNQMMQGGRFPHKAVYRVGHDNNGKLLGIDVTAYVDLGYLPNDSGALAILGFIDNAYYCANWRINIEVLKTNTPQHTFARAPGSTPGVIIMETMMEHVARTSGQDPIVVKTNNLYIEGQLTPVGYTLVHCNIKKCMSELMTSAQVDVRQQMCQYFNRDNRWKKKALSVVPLKFGIDKRFDKYTMTVSVYAPDGTVAVQSGGVEMGQGLNTKVAQVVAYELGLPVTMVSIKPPNSTSDANNVATGGSVGSEDCCYGAIQCCKAILARMAPVKQKMVNPTWADIVEKCYLGNVVLSERFTKVGHPPASQADAYDYCSFGATCTEVELDVLTGEYRISRVDIVFDCGESLNPAVDVGQVEGAFVMGLAYSTTEEVKYDTGTGKPLAFDTWTYHPPTNKDIPVDFRISLLKNTPNPSGVLRSKASGEPPLCMSCSVHFALRKCIEEARKEIGQTAYMPFDIPSSVERVQQACLVDPAQFTI